LTVSFETHQPSQAADISSSL